MHRTESYTAQKNLKEILFWVKNGQVEVNATNTQTGIIEGNIIGRDIIIVLNLLGASLEANMSHHDQVEFTVKEAY